ncbi:MAG TPA: UvrD-helicase domain-containing protein [Bryobacteraceae bacterium]|nr:UvrD-helicase domain-containing protein [Bryobacteraceae bacterium]
MAASDAAVRRRALESGESFLVEAPAGSGKTELLIQRYLALLARVQQPESIVALTFTRKAAAEMKERVLTALRQAAAGKPVANEYAAQTRALATAALAQNERQNWNIIDDTGRLQIGTIDSFCSLLTRQMPLLAKLGSPPRVLEFADELYYLAARRTIVALGETEAFQPVFHEAVLHFDGNLSFLQKLIAESLAKRDQWMRKLARHRGEELRAEINQLLGEELVRRLQRIADLWPDDVPGCPRVAADALPEWMQAADRFLYSKNKQPRKTVRCSDALARRPDFCEALHRSRKLIAPPISDQEWLLISNFTVILNVGLRQLEEVFRDRGEVDFTHISRSAAEALGAPDQPTELAYRLDFRIEHILVDEFQDTSLAQFELLERLTAQWSPGDGRTLFLVGDPMQSIYQFRDADVSLFIRAAEQGIGDILPERLRLCENFRSTKAIVRWVVDEFTRITPVKDDATIGSVTLRPTSAARSAQGITPHIHRLIDDDGTVEAEEVVEIARGSLAKGRSTAILVRARSHLDAILPALRKHEIPFEAVDLDALTSEQHILDLLSLTRAIHQLADRVAWLACLRAPFCGLTLSDLATLFDGRRDRTVLDILNDDSLIASLPASARQRVLRCRDVMSHAVEGFGRSPIRSLVEAAWIALGGPAALDGSNQRDDAASFFDLLEVCDAGGRISDFSLFQERLNYLFARPLHHSASRVQVMTIHKAKGLQFDTVIIPQLGRLSGRSDRDLLVWSTLPSDERSLVAGIPSTGTSTFSDPPYYNLVHDQTAQKEEAEQSRLLYVAVTRAREELHMLANAKTKKSGGELAKPSGFLKLLWTEAEAERFEAELARRLAAQSRQAELPLAAANETKLRRLSAAWRLPAARPSVPWTPPYQPETPSERKPTYDWVSETGRHAGSVVHDLLRRIAEDGIDTWPPSRITALDAFASREFERLGVPSFERAAAVARVLDALRNVIASERGRWILAPHAEAQCEWPLVGVVGERFINARIDRTFVDEGGTRWIIDYKTSTHEGTGRQKFLLDERARYGSQLNLYARLLEAAGEKQIAVGLYFPLLDEWVSWEIVAEEPALTAF